MELFKFRAKAINREPDREYRTDYKNGDWVYGLITDFGNKDYTLPAQMTNENGVSNIDVNIDTFGQFTGLQDMNGKDIYSGDIIEVLHNYKRVVKYSGIKASFVLCDKDGFLGFLGDYSSNQIKVIGNIYDNPELLEGE